MIDLFRNDAHQTLALPQHGQIKKVRHPRGIHTLGSHPANLL